VKIDIPKILMELRSEVKKAEEREGSSRLERLAFRIWAWVMRHPRIYEMAGMAAASLAPSSEGTGWVRSLPSAMSPPPVRAWLSQRDLPPSPSKSFRQMWRER
jgi:L-lactate utilization protein LutB